MANSLTTSLTGLKTTHLRRYRDIARMLWRHRPAEVRDPEQATDERAQCFADDLEKLGPTFIKLGQLLSTRPDLMPLPYVKALSRLQDDVEPFDVNQLEAIINAELGVRVSKAFSEFETKPLAAASLGQVHRAKMRDGRPVVVKVQRPGIRDQVLDDLDALARAAHLIEKHTVAGRSYELGLMLEEFKQSLLRELDYEMEAKNLAWLRDTLRDFPHIVVPAPVPDFTTTRVLTMEYVRGTKISTISPLAKLELDGGALAEEVFRAYLKQILVDGMFHADPHPGNVLLTEDRRIALIDLGMVAYLSPTWRDGLFRLLLSVAEGRTDEVADVCIELAEARCDFDERLFRKKTAQIVAKQQHASVDEIEVGRVVMELAQAATSTGMRVPSELTMLGKTLLNLDQVGRSLSPEFMPNEAIRRHANELMQQRMRQQVSPAHLFEKALELNDFMQRLPTRANRLLDALTHNRLSLRVDAIDEKVIIDGLQKIANRVAAGIVLAALIVGSAMLMRIETRFQIAGYPGIAILMFLTAAAGAGALVLDVLFKDEEGRGRKPEKRSGVIH